MSEDIERVANARRRELLEQVRWAESNPAAVSLDAQESERRDRAEVAIAALTTTPQVVTVEDRIERIERHLGLVSIGVDCTDAILNPEAGR